MTTEKNKRRCSPKYAMSQLVFLRVKQSNLKETVFTGTPKPALTAEPKYQKKARCKRF